MRQVAIAMLLCPLTAVAAPNEIKIFTDELAPYGGHTLEVHANKASRAGPRGLDRRAPDQLMPEYSYGFRQNWEVSLQLPYAVEHERARNDGYRAELQYVAPHDDDEGLYWGWNAEIARIARPGEARFWNAELIPIVGYRTQRWHFTANPGLERGISGDDRRLRWTPAGKAAYRVAGKNDLGAEYYAEQASRLLFLTWDGKIGKSDINLGVGRGLNDASDRLVVKLIYEVSF